MLQGSTFQHVQLLGVRKNSALSTAVGRMAGSQSDLEAKGGGEGSVWKENRREGGEAHAPPVAPETETPACPREGRVPDSEGPQASSTRH